jgi:hypothetical protein
VPELSSGEFLAAFVLAAFAGAAVFLHADKNGSRHPTAWAIGVFLFLGLALPAYAIHVWRTRRERRSS